MFAPVLGDSYRNSVVLHLPMTGENNSTILTDVSPSPKTITRYGDTKISTAQSKWGQGSGYFDGTVDYLTVPMSSLRNVLFTIELLVYRKNSASNMHIIGYNNTNVSDFWDIYLNTSGKVVFRYNGNSGILTSTGTLPNNQWVHLAIVYNGSSSIIYLNGVDSGSVNSGILTADGNATLGIGRNLYGSGFDQYLNGYLQDLRITQGVARYTADFTPPSGPFPARLPERPVQRIQQPSFHTVARLGL